jgi:hypothetical protein
MLGYPEVGCIENPPRQKRVIANRVERIDQFIEKAPMLSNGQPFYVLEDEIGGFQFSDDAHKVQHETVAWIVEYAMPNKRKTLAGRAAEDNIYPLGTDPRPLPQLACSKTSDRSRKHCTVWEVIFVRCTMDGVKFHRGCDIEASLLESQA